MATLSRKVLKMSSKTSSEALELWNRDANCFWSRLSRGVGEDVFEFVHAVQSMLSLQVTLVPKTPKRVFAEIVKTFFARERTLFELPSQGVEGQNGRWQFDLILNHTRPQTLVKTVSATDRTRALKAAKETIFEVGDIRRLKGTSDATVIADDDGPREKLWDADMLRVFEGYDIPVYGFLKDRASLIDLARAHRGLR